MDKEQYMDILDNALPGSFLKWKQNQAISPKDKEIFMQDGACPHTAIAAMQYLRDKYWNLIEWPAMSPTLNPIKHVWYQLKKQLYHKRHTIRNIGNLKAAMVEA